MYAVCQRKTGRGRAKKTNKSRKTIKIYYRTATDVQKSHKDFKAIHFMAVCSCRFLFFFFCVLRSSSSSYFSLGFLMFWLFFFTGAVFACLVSVGVCCRFVGVWLEVLSLLVRQITDGIFDVPIFYGLLKIVTIECYLWGTGGYIKQYLYLSPRWKSKNVHIALG